MILKKAIIAVLSLLVVAFIGLLLLNTLASILIVAIAILISYYLILLLAVLNFLKNRKAENNLIRYILFCLFLLPFLWALVDLEGMFNFLMQGITLDMK